MFPSPSAVGSSFYAMNKRKYSFFEYTNMYWIIFVWEPSLLFYHTTSESSAARVLSPRIQGAPYSYQWTRLCSSPTQRPSALQLYNLYRLVPVFKFIKISNTSTVNPSTRITYIPNLKVNQKEVCLRGLCIYSTAQKIKIQKCFSF